MPADSQRARMLADPLEEMGWVVEFLVPDASFQIPVYRDVEAAALRPRRTKIHEAGPRHDWFFRALGIRSMSWCALWPLYRQGCQVLQGGGVDLVYVTTTQFNFFCLGALWKRKFGVPYILDFQDPWFRESTHYETTPRNWKYHVNVRLAGHMERFALKDANGLIAVSPVYLDQLRRRYPSLRCVQPGRTSTIPFGVAEGDLPVALALSTSPESRPPPMLEILYVGAGRSIMVKSFRRICQGLARLKRLESSRVGKIIIRLFGTYAYWTASDPRELQEVAESEGVGKLVDEKPARIGYVEALGLALQANGLLVLGVDDRAYMPSKLFLYALTGKPLLACMRADSQVDDYFRRWPEIGTLIHFSGPAEEEALEDARLLEFLIQVVERKTFRRETVRLEFSASAMARHHIELFQNCLN